MANEREDLRAVADRLRGLDPTSAGEAREAGKQLSNQVGKLQSVNEIGGPSASPKPTQDNSPPAARHRHVLDSQQKDLVAAARGQRTGTEPNAMTQGTKGKNLAEIARSLREGGVSNARDTQEIKGPSHTPNVADREEARGHGR